MSVNKRELFISEISEYFKKKGYVVKEGGSLDLIIKKDNLTIPVEVKCRKRNVKNKNTFTVSLTMNQLMCLREQRCILLLVDRGHEFYEFRVLWRLCCKIIIDTKSCRNSLILLERVSRCENSLGESSWPRFL